MIADSVILVNYTWACRFGLLLDDFTKIADHSSNKAVKMRSLERLRRNEEWVKNKKLYQAKLHKTYVRPCDRVSTCLIINRNIGIIYFA